MIVGRRICGIGRYGLAEVTGSVILMSGYRIEETDAVLTWGRTDAAGGLFQQAQRASLISTAQESFGLISQLQLAISGGRKRQGETEE